MNGPLDLAHWVSRIQARMPGLGTVGLAGDLERVRNAQGALPGVWVLPAEERSAAPESEPSLHQQVRVSVSVISALRSYGDATGAKAADALRAHRAPLIAALSGWQPPDATTTASFVSGRRLGPANNAMWWEDVFETAFYLSRKAT